MMHRIRILLYCHALLAMLGCAAPQPHSLAIPAGSGDAAARPTVTAAAEPSAAPAGPAPVGGVPATPESHASASSTPPATPRSDEVVRLSALDNFHLVDNR